MYYEINVAFQGRHFFATAERSIQDRAHMLDVHREMVRAFPASKGYTVTVTKWETVGQTVDVAGVAEELDAETAQRRSHNA